MPPGTILSRKRSVTEQAAAVGGPANTLRWKKPTTQEIADNMDEFARTHNGSRSRDPSEFLTEFESRHSDIALVTAGPRPVILTSAIRQFNWRSSTRLFPGWCSRRLKARRTMRMISLSRPSCWTCRATAVTPRGVRTCGVPESLVNNPKSVYWSINFRVPGLFKCHCNF